MQATLMFLADRVKQAGMARAGGGRSLTNLRMVPKAGSTRADGGGVTLRLRPDVCRGIV
jgi:hypothetical protein